MAKRMVHMAPDGGVGDDPLYWREVDDGGPSVPKTDTSEGTPTPHEIGERILTQQSIDGRFTADQLQGFVLGYTARDTALDAMRVAMEKMEAVCRSMPRTGDGHPFGMGGSLWYVPLPGEDEEFGVREVGVLAIVDPDDQYWEDYPEGERWEITVRDGDGHERDTHNGRLFMDRAAALALADKLTAATGDTGGTR